MRLLYTRDAQYQKYQTCFAGFDNTSVTIMDLDCIKTWDLYIYICEAMLLVSYSTR